MSISSNFLLLLYVLLTVALSDCQLRCGQKVSKKIFLVGNFFGQSMQNVTL